MSQSFHPISGGRTRSVVNLANPGGTAGVAYTFTAATAVPSGATAGYKNYGLNKNLHILIMNNDAAGCVFKIWGYHSFAEQWGLLDIIDPATGDNNVIEISVAKDIDEYTIVPIEGIERIAIQATTYAGGNSCTCYLGVNTI